MFSHDTPTPFSLPSSCSANLTSAAVAANQCCRPAATVTLGVDIPGGGPETLPFSTPLYNGSISFV